MIDFKKNYRKGIKAFKAKNCFYDVFSGFPLINYVGKYYDYNGHFIMKTWLENSERNFIVISSF